MPTLTVRGICGVCCHRVATENGLPNEKVLPEASATLLTLAENPNPCQLSQGSQAADEVDYNFHKITAATDGKELIEQTTRAPDTLAAGGYMIRR